ncbi:DNA-binding PucR family transcriptional regulator [Lipingzhangella halophila]|uniref:DNA-binding PucR family transcriptional regulator n=1 Tax=Lipingzhangella halophila TaxID=1783352 RepID=A0A7W7RD06_9ACTN|nr:helix-turn-helix domain-containing protein [Lipingzhangella halophila]MBB4929751.1 DNA-binding PucR family transcriptional regulator [Lipingzhangella halophila]
MNTELDTSEDTAASGGVLLRQLLLTVGAPLVDVLAAPAGLDLRVGNVVILDPDDESEAFAGDLVLLIGARGGAARHLISSAARRGAAAVAVKVSSRSSSSGEVEQLRAAASESGVALLAVRPDVRWDQLQSLCRNVVEDARLTTETELGDSAGDLFSLAQSISTLTGGLVTIEDAASRVLAYSSGEEGDELRRLSILGRQGPEQYLGLLREWGVFTRLRSSDEVVHIDERPELGIRRRLAVGVRAGSQPLGTIWVQERSQPLAEGAEEALVGAARVTSLQMVRHRTEVTAGLRLREDLLAGLLEGRVEAAALSDTIKVSPDRAALVMALTLDTPGAAYPDGHERRPDAAHGGDRSGQEMRRRRMVDLVSVHAAAYRHAALVTALGHRVYVLLPDITHRSESSALALTRKTVRAARGMFGASVQGAVGSLVDSLSDVPWSRGEADRILDAMGRDLDTDVATISEVRARVLVSETLAHVRKNPSLRDPRVDRLIAHDAESGGKLVASLLAYLADFGDVRRAAGRLHIHPNTLRYRLRRAESVSGLDLSDSNERLFTHLQLLMQHHR